MSDRLKYLKRWRRLNSPQISVYNRYYYQLHKRRIKKQHKIRYNKKKRILNKKNCKYILKRRHVDPSFKLRGNLRKQLYSILKRKQIVKKCSVLKLIGCSFICLKQHLEKQFKKGMNWQNYGKWQVDHIKPLALFDLTKISQQKIAFNYKNLQPLWAKENLKKRARYG